MQPSGDHQVEHQPEIAFDADCNALPNAAQFANRAALNARKWRIDGAQQEDGCQPNPLERLAEDARFERSDVGGDVGQFRHCSQIAAECLRLCNEVFTRGSPLDQVMIVLSISRVAPTHAATRTAFRALPVSTGNSVAQSTKLNVIHPDSRLGRKLRLRRFDQRAGPPLALRHKRPRPGARRG